MVLLSVRRIVGKVEVEFAIGVPLQHPDFQWLVSCGLQFSNMISMELTSKSSICSFQFVRTSEVQLALLERVEVR